MRIIDLLESGTASSKIEDLRDPSSKLDYNGRPHAQMLVLTKNGGALRFNWGSNNIVNWDEIVERANKEIDTSVQSDWTQISPHRTGFIIGAYTDSSKWSGKRTKYSTDVRIVAQALLDRGLARRETPLWIGNWAARSGTSIGSVGKLLDRPADPKRLVLYHGTDNYRLAKIMRDGLMALDKSSRVWNRDTKMPAHREDSIYLTADMGQAEYYAKKSVAVDKARGGRNRSYWSDPDWPDKLAPVVIMVQLGVNDMKLLKADDDFLSRYPDADPNDWRQSLEKFAQVAYSGTVPPSRIRIIR